MYLWLMQKSLRGADIVPVGVACYTAPEAARLLGGYACRSAEGAMVEAAPLWRHELPRPSWTRSPLRAGSTAPF